MKSRLHAVTAILALAVLLPAQPAEALSAVHHVYNFSRRCVKTVVSPIYGALVQGPRDIKAAYHAEVWEPEKEEDRGLLRNKLYAAWRAPGVEAKAIIDGFVGGFSAAGDGLKELVSIGWGD